MTVWFNPVSPPVNWAHLQDSRTQPDRHAVEVLKGIPKTQSELIFSAHGAPHNPISGVRKWKKKLHQLSATSDWTLHDIRRTVSTGMAKSGVPPHVTERVLNHKTCSLGGVAGVYNRFGYLPEMRAALDVWSGHILRIVTWE
jgi:hypothetical protein